MGYRVLALGGGIAALVLFANLSVGVAQDPGRRDKDLDTQAATTGNTFQGKIARVDAKARVVIFNEMMRYDGAEKASLGTPGAPGRSVNRGTGDAGPPARLGMVTANVPPGAVILLDGKKADLKDLKEGYFARIDVPSGGSAPGRTGGGAGGVTGGGGAAKTPPPVDIRPGAKVVGRTVTATRVEATSRSPGAETETSRSSGPAKP